MDRCIDDVELYLTSADKLEFARKASLFYKANVNYIVSADRQLIRAHPDDLLGFVPRTIRDCRIGKAIVEPIVSSNHELQVHIHHEHYTYNDSCRDRDTFAYLQTIRGRSFDDARFELALRLGIDTLREDGGVALDRWFFIHGHWALNASDPHECNIVREIEILKRNGCLGDFTQPSGRVHVDSRISVPYSVVPAALPKGYDTPEADPIEAAGLGGAAPERFFIWASESTHKICSIDTYSPFVQQRLKYPEITALEHAKQSVVINGVLYLKTHCHSLHPLYFAPDGLPMPHLDPLVQNELNAIFKAADKAGVAIKFMTASEVYDSVVFSPPTPKIDLVSRFGLDQGEAMEPIGLTVEFRTRDGRPAQPPQLGARQMTFPDPSLVAEPEAPGDGDEASKAEEGLVSAHIVPLSQSLREVSDGAPSRQAPILDALTLGPELMGAADVVRLNDVASIIALKAVEEMGGESSGVTGFYAPRAQQGELLQQSEVLCAHFVRSRLPTVRRVYEIGCGLGLLSTLLALRGVEAVGVERNRARLTTGQRIAEQFAPDRKSPRWIRGVFPKAVRAESGLAASVALVTNLLGSATEEQQSSFIDGLRAFGAVLIDAQRFYVRRVSKKQVNELKEKFAKAGFDEPLVAFDLGPDGHFLLFMNSRPKVRLGIYSILSRMGLSSNKPLTLAD